MKIVSSKIELKKALRFVFLFLGVFLFVRFFALGVLKYGYLSLVFPLFFALASFILLTGLDLKKYIAPILIASIVLSPGIVVISGMPALRGEDIILIFIIGLFLLKTTIAGKIVPKVDSVTKIFIFMGLSAFLSICGTSIIYNKPILLKDFFILPQMFKYYVVFAVARSMDMHEQQAKIYINIIIIVGLLAALVGLFQYYNLFSVNSWLTPLYTAEGRLDALSLGAVRRRIVGTSGNPNFFGYILGCVFCFITGLTLHAINKKVKIFAWVSLGVVGITAALTLSRTTMLTFGIIFFSALVLRQIAVRGVQPAFKYLFIVIIVALFFLKFVKSEGFEGRVSIGDNSTKVSYDARIRDLVVPFREASNSLALMIFGQGPSKIDLRTDSHSEFGWYFQRFGAIGLLLYLWLLWVILKKGVQKYRLISGLRWQSTLYLSIILIMINWFVFACAGNMFKAPQAMSLNMFIVGLLFAKDVTDQGQLG